MVKFFSSSGSSTAKPSASEVLSPPAVISGTFSTQHSVEMFEDTTTTRLLM